MKRLWPSALVIGLLVMAPLFTHAQGKKIEDGAPATEEDYKAIAKTPDMIGKLGASVSKSVTLVVETKKVTIDQAKVEAAQRAAIQAAQSNSGGQPNYSSAVQQQYSQAQQMAQLQQQYMQIMQATTPQQRQQRMQTFMQTMARMQMQAAQNGSRQYQQMQQQMMQQMQRQMQAAQNADKNSPYKVESTFKSYEFNIKDDVIVRRMSPAFGYDDKGNLKQYTPAELQKLKGKNTKLPGYEAKIEDLEPGQTVQVFIMPPKEGKVGDVDLVGNIIRPEVRMIVLAADDTLNAAPGGLGLGGGVNAPGIPKQ